VDKKLGRGELLMGIKFNKTQENGDATSNYNITTSAKTVREFVHEVI
jgi:hypothetical protein